MVSLYCGDRPEALLWYLNLLLGSLAVVDSGALLWRSPLVLRDPVCCACSAAQGGAGNHHGRLHPHRRHRARGGQLPWGAEGFRLGRPPPHHQRQLGLPGCSRAAQVRPLAFAVLQLCCLIEREWITAIVIYLFDLSCPEPACLSPKGGTSAPHIALAAAARAAWSAGGPLAAEVWYIVHTRPGVRSEQRAHVNCISELLSCWIPTVLEPACFAMRVQQAFG
jgi:hypothetical protein